MEWVRAAASRLSELAQANRTMSGAPPTTRSSCLDPAPGRCRSTRTVARVEDIDALCRTIGVAPEDFHRTLFASLLAAAFAEPQITAVSGAGAFDGVLHVHRIAIDDERSMAANAAAWHSERAVRRADAGLHEFIAAYLDATGRHGFAFLYVEADEPMREESALSFQVRSAGANVEIVIDASDERLSAQQAATFVAQYAIALSLIADAPALPVVEIIRRLPPLQFELTIASQYEPAVLRRSFERLGRQIGLHVAVTSVQLGELRPAVQPWADARCGATIILVEPDGGIAGSRDPLTGLVAGARGRTRLTSHIEIIDKNPNETRELFDEIFVRRAYLRAGLHVRDGAVVVDVGANIGMFSLFAHAEATGVTVHAFEPAPELVSMLRENLRANRVDATVHGIGLGAQRTHALFAYYPRSTLQSGFHTDAAVDADVVRRYTMRQAGTLQGPAVVPVGTADAVEPVAALMQGRFDREFQRIDVHTLSEMIDRLRLTVIDVLKIDVEHAEEEVLAGLGDAHWPLVQQLAVEVHDHGGRLDRLRSLVAARGFEVSVEQDPLFESTGIYMLFATRATYLLRVDDRGNDGRHAAITAAALAQARHDALPVSVVVCPRTPWQAADGALAMLLQRMAATDGIELVDLCRWRPAQAPGTSTHAATPDTDALATQIFRRITHGLRPPPKALVVDADNLLWGGICGEIGPAGVVVDGAYADLQTFLRQQKEAGRLLFISSKNNLDDVLDVFARQPSMPLRLADFTAVRANWRPKSENIREIAQEFSLGLESIVFLDDSPAERAEVLLRLPEVTVIELPAEASDYARCLAATWALDIPRLTDEDRRRHERVRTELHRRGAALDASHADYLHHLDVQVNIRPSEENDIERIAQLARRTNQFNVSLRRLTATGVRRLLESSDAAFSVRVADRFGSYGLVGFVAGVRHDATLEVTDLFLSCRVLGRNVEWAMLQHVGAFALHAGFSQVAIRAAIGQRNRPALSFVRQMAHMAASDCTEPLAASVDTAALAAIDWRNRVPDVIANQQEQRAPTRSLDFVLHTYSWPDPTRATPAGTPSRRLRPRLAVPYLAPSGHVENRIAGIWRAACGIDDVGVHDELRACGGDSLTALTISAGVQAAFGSTISLDEFLDHPTIAALAMQITRAQDGAAGIDGETGDTVDVHAGDSRASDGQRRIWVAEQVAGERNDQIIPLAYDIDGAIDLAALERAIGRTLERHPALHSVLVPSHGDLVVRRCESRFALACDDLRALTGAQREERQAARECAFFAQRFDLGVDLPLRALVIRRRDNAWRLLVAVHHASADGWSIGLIQRDISAAYAGPSDNATATPAPAFAAYASRVRRNRRAGRYAAALDRLRPLLAPVGESASPTGAVVRGSMSLPHFTRFALPPRARDAATAIARRSGVTSPIAYLAAFALFVASYRRSNGALVGYVVANRSAARDADTVGFFANILPLTTTVDHASSLGAHAQAACRATVDAQSDLAVPYGLLLEALTGDPFRFDAVPFDALFTYQPPPVHDLSLAGCRVTPAQPRAWPVPFGFLFDIEDSDTATHGLIRWNAGQANDAMAAALERTYAVILEAMHRLADRPAGMIADLLHDAPWPATAPAGPAPRRVVTQLIGPARRIDAELLPDAVARYARKTPDAIAACNGATMLSYAQLLTRSDAVANQLRSLGVAGGDGVVVCMARTPQLLVVLIAVLRCGAYFVPVDARHPDARKRVLMADARPRAIVIDSGASAVSWSGGAPVLSAGPDGGSVAASGAWHGDPPRPDDLAYLLYTSGSSGAPKGVEISHAALMNYLAWAAREYDAAGGTGTLAHSSIGFDLALTSLFVPLLCGNCVETIESDDIEVLADVLRNRRDLSFLKLTPGALDVIAGILRPAQIAAAARHLVLGGEQLHAKTLAPLRTLRGLRITNEYGPTETTVGCCAYTFDAADAVPDPVPIGMPIWNTCVELLGPVDGDASVGELAIRGAGLARGYRNRPAENAARFVACEGTAHEGCYLSGDLCRWSPAGQLAFLRRDDRQVKRHGYRIELGEIEAILRRCDGIDAAAVVVHAGAGPALVKAYVIAAPPTDAVLNRLDAFIASELPPHARPDHIGVVDALPLALSRKVDRHALAEWSMDAAAHDDLADVDPRHAGIVSRAWCTVLGSEPPGSRSSFFAHGGDSIKALQLVAELKRAGFALTVLDVVGARTFGAIVRVARPSAHADRRRRTAYAGDIGLTPKQAAFLALDDPHARRWHLRWFFGGRTGLAIDRLGTAFAAVVDRHAALRTRFTAGSEGWTARIDAAGASQAIDLIAGEPVASALSAQAGALAKALDLAQGPLVRLGVVTDARPIPCCVWIVHHLVADYVSLDIMTRELWAAYDDPAYADATADSDEYVEWLCSQAEAAPMPPYGRHRLGQCREVEYVHRDASQQVRVDAIGAHTQDTRAAVLAALLQALRLSQPACSAVCVEGNGRLDGTLDLSSVVGWLTTYDVIDADEYAAFTGAPLMEQLRSRLARPVPPSGTLPGVALNYLGRMATSGTSPAAGQLFAYAANGQPESPVLFALELVCWTDDDAVHTVWRFDQQAYDERSVRDVIHRFSHALADLREREPTARPATATPDSADDLSGADLARILEQFSQ